MSHKERQPWTGTTTAVAVLPPKSSGAAAEVRSPSPPQCTALSTSQWELLYRSVSPVQQAELLALASQQGLLYSHQLPPTPSMRSQSTADEPRSWNLLGKLLNGQVGQIEAVRAGPIAVVDEALDETQRHAVAVALATPDVGMIQGLPGTGKSRVVAEIITQAVQRGDRVLLAAAHGAALDRVLELVAQRESLCPIRCLAPEENVAQLPPTIRAVTLGERTATVRGQTLRMARDTRQAAEMQCARRRHEEPLWGRLEELGTAVAAAQDVMARTKAKIAGVEAEVVREVETRAGRLGGEVKALERAGEVRLAQQANDITAAQQQRADDCAKLAELAQQIEAVLPLATAKQRGSWWTPVWWKATFKGDVVAQLVQLQTRHSVLQAAIDALDHRLQVLAEARRESTEKSAADIKSRVLTEIISRQTKLRSNLQHQQDEVQRQQNTWDDLSRQIDPETLRPKLQTADAVHAAHKQWQSHRQEDETRCAFARAWAEFLESSSDALAGRLPGYANLVAATPAALAADPHFGDAGAEGGHFDLLVLDEADQLTESEFLKAARRARRWVLVGEPALWGDSPRSGRQRHESGHVAGSGRGQCFYQLWEHLHFDPSLLPQTWFREGQRLGCRLRHLSPEQRHCLENEPLADAPEVELRILAMPRARPELAEVLFPGTMTVPEAKAFLFREMQEIAVQTSGRGLRLCETAESTVLHFSPTPEGAHAVTLDNGVREYLAGRHLDRTCKVEFDRVAGWDRVSVAQWIEQHLSLRDLGRTVWLDVPQRMTDALAGVVADLIGTGATDKDLPNAASEGPAVEFVPVLGSGKHQSPGRNEGRGPRKSEPTANGLPPTGAGLETDLAATRPGDRIPNELRGLAPGRGFVNPQEARAVIRKLEELLRLASHANGRGLCPTFAVIALYPAQAELIRNLILQSPRLAPHASAIAVGLPAAFRQREADVVVVSLTRSHSHRAVTYGEGPASLVMALTRARRRLVLVGDPGNLLRRSQWRGVLDHLDEATANREAWLVGQLVRYLQGNGRHQWAFRKCESGPA